MAIVSGKITISSIYAPMIRRALMEKIYNPGESYSRAQMFLMDAAATPADKELLDICLELMQEIMIEKRGSYNGRWYWERSMYGYYPYADDCKLISEIVGCWCGDEGFYVNQDHEAWQSW